MIYWDTVLSVVGMVIAVMFLIDFYFVMRKLVI
jgi:hypothetical protein